MRRKGAGPRLHIGIEGQERAVFAGLQPGFDDELPGVDVRQKGFQPVGDPSDRPAEQARRRDHGKLVGISVELEAEGAADIRADDPHPVHRQAEQPGPDILHLVRRLAGLEHHQRSVRRIVVGEHGAALQGHAGLAFENEAAPGRRRGGRGGTGLPERPAQHEVAFRLRMSLAVADRRIGVAGRRRQRVDLQLDGLGGVAGAVEAVGDGERDRLALVVHAAVGERRLGRRPVFRNRRRARDHRLADRPQIVGRQHGGDAGQGAGGGRIQRRDPAVGDRAAQEGAVQHPRRRQIGGKAPAPGDQPARLAARNRSVGQSGHAGPVMRVRSCGKTRSEEACRTAASRPGCDSPR